MSHFKLILVKHSLPEIIPELPASQWKLSAQGKTSCIPLARQLALYKPQTIVSSEEPKALQTASILAEELNLQAFIVADLHEQERPKPGLLSAKKFEEQVKALFANPEIVVLGSETAAQAQSRFHQAVMKLTTQHQDETILVISHGTVITLFLQMVCQVEPFPLWKSLGLPSYVVLNMPGFQLEKIVPTINSKTTQ